MNELNGRSIDFQVKEDFNQAKRKTFWRYIRTFVGYRCNDLLPGEHLLRRLLHQDFEQMGLQKVPLKKIKGSIGRHRDFDLEFNPRSADREGRWQRVARAHRQGLKLPPPLLYKVGDIYLVEDGNHRISVAKAAGQDEIEARVIALDHSILTANPACSRLGYAVEKDRSDAAACK